MRKTLIIFLIVFCNSIYGQKNKSYQCYWHERNTDVFNTNAGDFKYSDEDMLYYRISNDSNNIYIDLKIFDDEIKQEILYSGLTIWIDPLGKKTKSTGIVYPVRSLPGHNGKMAEHGDSSGANNPQNFHNMYEHNVRAESGENRDIPANSLMLLGFSASGPIIITDFEKEEFKGSIRVRKDQNMLYYEVVLPVSKLHYINSSSKGTKKQSTLMMGFDYNPHIPMGFGGSHGNGGKQSSWNGHGDSGEGGSMNHSFGGMHGGGGGMHGGGMHGGGGMHDGGKSRGPVSQSASESEKIFWLKSISLAEGQ